jgi:plasmid stabilization system protein ParE
MAREYRVIVTPKAADDIQQEHAWLQERNPRAAEDWLAGIRKLILGLALMPESHAIAAESAAFDVEIRRALYGRSTRWRVYFTISGGDVQVLHVRHGRRSDWQS